MRELIRQAMEDGALGVPTSLHQTPGFWISTDELVEMAKVAGAYGGIYSSHIRTEGEEYLRLCRRRSRLENGRACPSISCT